MNARLVQEGRVNEKIGNDLASLRGTARSPLAFPVNMSNLGLYLECGVCGHAFDHEVMSRPGCHRLR